jgi:hypothetical protein
MSTSKQRHLMGLLQDMMTTAQVVFSGTERQYTYKVPKAWNLQAGQSVVVDSPHNGLTTAVVVSVDKTPRLDENASFVYKWAVQKVDRSWYDEQLAREQLFLEQLDEVERQHKRQETLRKANEVLGGDFSEASLAFKAAVAGLTGAQPVAQA